MALLLKAIGGIAALLLLVTTLLGTIVSLGGFLLGAIKVLIIVVFIAVVALIGFSILRDRSNQRRASSDI